MGVLHRFLLLLITLITCNHFSVAIERCPGTRPGTFYYHVGDGFYYNRNRVTDQGVYFKCIQYETGCRGRAVFSREVGFAHTSNHNHNPDLYFSQYSDIRHRILQRCGQLDHIPFRVMIAQEAVNCHRTVLARLRTRAMRLAMTRARRKAYPAIPHSLRALTNVLQNRRYRALSATKDGADNLFACSVTANDGSHAVLFASRRMLDFMRQCHTLQSDGTFRSVPAAVGAAQVFVILTTWNYNIIPLMWVLMENKEEILYRAVLAAVGNLMGPRWRLRNVITDWEAAQRNAWRAVRPQVRHQGCYWHYTRAVLRYAREVLNLNVYIRNDRFVRGIMRLVCALPLLPGNINQRRGLLLITRIVRRRGRFYFLLLRGLLAYIWRRWVNNRARRASLSFFGSVHRTNNCCECHNRNLNSMFHSRHPNIYAFIEALCRMEENAHADLHALMVGLEPSRRRRTSAIANDRTLQNLGRGLRLAPDRRGMAIVRFLFRAGFTIRRYFNDEVFRVRRGQDNEFN